MMLPLHPRFHRLQSPRCLKYFRRLIQRRPRRHRPSHPLHRHLHHSPVQWFPIRRWQDCRYFLLQNRNRLVLCCY